MVDYTGSLGADSFHGTDNADTLRGAAGSDTLVGLAGNDVIFGGIDDDLIFGDNGNDSLYGKDGNDVVHSGQGEDYVEGENGADTIYGNEGADTLLGGEGNDYIEGNESNDLIEGNQGDDIIKGGTGGDTIYGNEGNDFVEGGDNDDSLIGGDGNDTIKGDAGGDTIQGNAGDDSLEGGDGDDEYLFAADHGHDYISDDDGSIILDGMRVGTGANSLNGVATAIYVSEDNYLLSHNGQDYELAYDENTSSLAISKAGDIDHSITINNFVGGSFGIKLGHDSGTFLTERPEFLVNAYQSSYQQNSSVAVMENGDFIIAWESYGQDGDNLGVYKQHFYADGTKNGTELKVNDYIYDNQHSPNVVAISDTEYVITWEGRGGDTSHNTVQAKLYSIENPNHIGSEFTIGDIEETKTQHSTTSLEDGGFVSVWRDSSSYDIYGQRYHGDGTLNGDQFRVDTASNADSAPTITSLQNGGFIVSWGADDQDGSGYGVYGQIFNADGSRKGVEFQINSSIDNDQEISDVTALDDGGFIAVWEDRGVEAASGIDISAQRFDGDGNKVGSEFTVNTHTNSPQYYTSITTLSDGNFIVVWQSDGQNEGSNGIYGQRFNSDGSKNGEEFLINDLSEAASDPSVEALHNGGFIVTYNAMGVDNDHWGIAAKMYEGRSDVVQGTAGSDIIIGGNEGDMINGINGDDLIIGGQGNDSITGGNDDDLLYGNEGNDTLVGESGSDTLEGGLGSDRFVFEDAQDTTLTYTDIITDFDTVEDLIIVRGLGFDSITNGTASGSTLAYSYDSNDDITTITSDGSFALELSGNITLADNHFEW